MSKKEKLLKRAQSLPNNFSFKEFESLLKHFGYHRVKTNAGSNMKWRNIEGDPVYAPRKKHIKPVYIEKFLKSIKKI